MSAIRRLRMEILQRADATGEVPIRLSELATKCGVTNAHVRDELEDLYHKGYIGLTAWDGNYRKPLDEWPSRDAFFESSLDGAYKWLRLRSKGREILDDLKSELATENNESDEHLERKIGFV